MKQVNRFNQTCKLTKGYAKTGNWKSNRIIFDSVSGCGDGNTQANLYKCVLFMHMHMHMHTHPHKHVIYIYLHLQFEWKLLFFIEHTEIPKTKMK